jgi:hypothetical protein
MDSEHDSSQDTRATILVVAVAVLFGIPCIGFLGVITDGLIVVVPIGLVLIGAIAFIHYVFWGRSMAQSTAGEREEVELREKLEAEEWDLPETRRPHRPV